MAWTDAARRAAAETRRRHKKGGITGVNGATARQVFDSYAAARQSEREAYGRTPQGIAEKDARNQATIDRMRTARFTGAASQNHSGTRLSSHAPAGTKVMFSVPGGFIITGKPGRGPRGY